MSAEDMPFNRESAKFTIDFLKNNVPRSDIPNVEAELKKDLVLAKKKQKNRKRPTKRKPQCLTRVEKQKLGFFSMPRDSVKYQDVLPMNLIWKDYMAQILDLSKPVPSNTDKNWDSFTQSLFKADFHGAILTVVRSKCPSYVGKKGICIMDTRQTFKIVGEDNKITTILKKNCVFDLQLKDFSVKLFGKHLCFRPAERSTKKIKTLLLPDL